MTTRLPVPCPSATHAIQQLANHFVMAENIDAALTQAARHSAYRYSFDILGESALTYDDAQRYYQAYYRAIETLAEAAQNDLFANPGISIKLSALYPRYEALQHRYAIDSLSKKLLALAKRARDANISVTIDAEESERLDMSLDNGKYCTCKAGATNIANSNDVLASASSSRNPEKRIAFFAG